MAYFGSVFFANMGVGGGQEYLQERGHQRRVLGRGCDEALFSEKKGFSYFSVKKRVFIEKGGGNSVNEGFGKDFYRKGNSVKRSGPFSEPPDSEN